MHSAMPLPIWVLALVLAALAPLLAKLLASTFERRARARSVHLLSTVQPPTSDDEDP